MRGLCEKIKHFAAFTFLKKQRGDVVALVETHVEERLQMALRRPWVGWTFYSAHTSHSRGVSILIAKSVHFELGEICTDTQGRYVFLSTKLYGEPFLLLAFYVPPILCLCNHGGFMARHPSIHAVWLGDFNTTLNPALYRLQPPSLTTRAASDTTFYRLVST